MEVSDIKRSFIFSSARKNYHIIFFSNRGAGPGSNSQEVNDKLSDLKDEIRKLEEHEKMLDTHTNWVKQSIKNVEYDTFNRRFAYIKYEDLKEIFKDEFILAIQAPPDTQLNVPKIDKVEKLL